MRMDDPDLPHVSAEQIEAGRKVLEAGLSRGDNPAWIAFDVFAAMTKAGKPSTDLMITVTWPLLWLGLFAFVGLWFTGAVIGTLLGHVAFLLLH
jgi:hypothetical protein